MKLLTYQSVTSWILSDLYGQSGSHNNTVWIKLDTGAGGNMLPYHIMLPSDIWKELFPGRCIADLKGTIEKGVTLQVYNKSEIPQLGTFYSGIYLCPVYSYVHLCSHHLFPCASMCAPFIPMCIYVCTIYSHVHLCELHLFPCASICAQFIPMCIYVCNIYSHVHLCVQHLFPCVSICAPFIAGSFGVRLFIDLGFP